MKKKNTGPRVTPPGVQIQPGEKLDEAIARTLAEMKSRGENTARLENEVRNHARPADPAPAATEGTQS